MNANLEHTTETPDPAKLRGIFGANLRQLSGRYPSIAGLCRDLGINRTQFNRYLSGESFPRPDVLHRICSFFQVDARVLLQPVDSIAPVHKGLLQHPSVASFLGTGATSIPEEDFPSGFYRFSRMSFFQQDRFVVGLVYVFRRDGFSFVRGYEPKEAMRDQGLSVSATNREFRGVLLRQDLGIAALISRHDARTSTFNFLTRSGSYENNFWTGYVTRTVAEDQTSRRVTRMVYEHMGGDFGAVLRMAKTAGMKRIDDLSAFHSRLLKLGEPFN